MDTRVTLAADAALVLREMLILGRHGEPGGCCVSRIRADYDGAPLLRHETSVDGTDQASLGPAILAGNRSVGSVLIVEPGWAEPPTAVAPGVAVMPLTGPAVLVSALAPGALVLQQRLDWALRIAGISSDDHHAASAGASVVPHASLRPAGPRCGTGTDQHRSS
jgi:urease accessory protein